MDPAIGEYREISGLSVIYAVICGEILLCLKTEGGTEKEAKQNFGSHKVLVG